MEKVMVQIDWYTKIILTLIVVLLAGLLARPYVEPRIARGAYDQIIDVNVGGSLSLDIPAMIDVDVSGVEDLVHNNERFPFYVEIK